jgi:segregation and condensation protein B
MRRYFHLQRPVARGIACRQAEATRAVDKGALFRGVFLHASPPESSDAGDEATGRDPRLARLEAVLFLANEPLSTRKLARFTSLADGTEARTLIRVLNRLYDASGTAFRVEEVAGGFQLLTRERFAPWLRRLYQTPVETRLSSPALETLAVVAYRQPVLRAEIEAIRGVQSGEILRQLMERDLVRITGRSAELGRPFLYGTTRRFLQTFGLRNLDELPRAEALRSASVNSTLPAELDSPNQDTTPGVTGGSDTHFPSNRQEEPEVRISIHSEPQSTELLDRPVNDWLSELPSVVDAKDEEEDEEFEDEDDEDDDDDVEDEEDDLEEDEWEEVDDDVDEEEFDEDDEDWDDEDDDWDDDDEEEDEEEEEWEEE